MYGKRTLENPQTLEITGFLRVVAIIPYGHTYVTRLFEAGLDIKEIQYLAGHSTVDMTLRVYTHYDRVNREAKTAEKVRDALKT